MTHTDRPFEDVEEMNESLIERWNARVKPGDDVYHLGDFSFLNPVKTGEIIRRLNGNIHFIRGNHDQSLVKIIERETFQNVVWLKDYYILKHEGARAILLHYPLITWDGAHRGWWHLHGHSHGNLADDGQPRMDVGVDTTPTLAPYHWDEIVQFMEGRVFSAMDHHGAD